MATKQLGQFRWTRKTHGATVGLTEGRTELLARAARVFHDDVGDDERKERADRAVAAWLAAGLIEPVKTEKD